MIHLITRQTFISRSWSPGCSPNLKPAALEYILSKQKNRICCIYIDDIIIFGRTKTEHDKNLLEVLAQLNKFGVKLSKEKLNFCKKRVKFLGHEISAKGVSTDPDKVKAVKDWPRPETMKELNSFLGFINYYRKFIRNFSFIVEPLERIAKKEKTKRRVQIVWNKDLENSFTQLKDALISATSLCVPKTNRKFILDTDASKFAIGAVLSQLDETGKECPIYFASNRLSTAEQNYCTTRRELLAIVKYTKFFHHYLAGANFTIRTDHKSLSWLMGWKTPSTAQYFTWISSLQEYNFEIVYRDGKSHLNADALSRIQFCNKCKIDHVVTIKNTPGKVKNEVDIIKSAILADTEPLNKDSITNRIWLHRENLSIEHSRLYVKMYGKKLEILSQSVLRETAKNLHSTFAHIGAKNLYKVMEKYFWAPKMQKVCKELCKSCVICLRRKAISVKSTKLILNSGKRPFDKVYIDVAGPFPDCLGYNYILVLVDSFSSYPLIVPMKSVTSSEIIKNIFENWISYFGAPNQLHSDNATYFHSEEMKRFLMSFNIKQTFSAPYHPQSNGKVERLMRTIKDMIHSIAIDRNLTWVDSIAQTNFSLRCCLHNECGLNPYEVVFGQEMKFMKNSKQIEVERIENLLESTLQKHSFHQVTSDKINVGDMVMMRIFPVTHCVYKPRFYGPFKVEEVKGHGNCIVALDDKGRRIVRNIHDVKTLNNNPINEKLTARYEAKPQSNSEPISCENDDSNDNKPPAMSQRYPRRERQHLQRYGYDAQREGV